MVSSAFANSAIYEIITSTKTHRAVKTPIIENIEPQFLIANNRSFLLRSFFFDLKNLLSLVAYTIIKRLINNSQKILFK